MATTQISLEEAINNKLLLEEEVIKVIFTHEGTDLKLVTGTWVRCENSLLLSAVYAGKVTLQNVGRILEEYQKPF